MISYEKKYLIQPEWLDKELVIKKAEEAFVQPMESITDVSAKWSAGGIHDYYSNGDYWWPDLKKPDGLPFIRRDGETNPENFNDHRMILRRMRTKAAYLAGAYRLTGREDYVLHGIRLLKRFFLDEETKMNPNLTYAQAIPGVCEGRGIGIIDTLHLVDVVFAIEEFYRSGLLEEETYGRLREWFATYLDWMLTSKNGMEEMNADNNHSVCYFVQASAFALFTENERIVEFCRNHYKHVLLKQMEVNGSFPRELDRTKPYSYSIFVMDNMVSICELLSTPQDDLWFHTLPEGQGIQKGLDFIFPYIEDKKLWPYPADVMHFDAFPARSSMLMFAGCRLGQREFLDFYQSLPADIVDEEARRNIAVRLPWLWMG